MTVSPQMFSKHIKTLFYEHYLMKTLILRLQKLTFGGKLDLQLKCLY